MVTSSILSGPVQKAIMILTPRVINSVTPATSTTNPAVNKIISTLRHFIAEDGFVVVREEFRTITPEVASCIAYNTKSNNRFPINYEGGGPAAGRGESGDLSFDASKVKAHNSLADSITGYCYVFVVARSNAPEEVKRFVNQLASNINSATNEPHLGANYCDGASCHALQFLNSSSYCYVAPDARVAANAITLLFPKITCFSNGCTDLNNENIIISDNEARAYIHDCGLEDLLMKVLSEIANKKPANNIKYLADYLLDETKL